MQILREIHQMVVIQTFGIMDHLYFDRSIYIQAKVTVAKTNDFISYKITAEVDISLCLTFGMDLTPKSGSSGSK